MAARSALTPRKKPLQERSRRTVAAILTAAAQVLERRGYASATTDAIAERAGVSVGSVYQYFPNKDAILVALVEQHIEQGFAHLRDLLEGLPDGPLAAEDLVRRFVEGMMRLHSKQPRLHRVLFQETPLPRALRRRMQSQEDAFAEQVATLLADWPGGVRPRCSQLAAHVAVRAVESLIHGLVLHPPPDIDADEFCEEVVALVVRYLDPASARSQFGSHR